ncbi:MAG: hypothetical protein WCP93_02090 [Candidatus Berkelbacteria bacterium]
MDNENDFGKSTGFAGHSTETKNNITDSEMLDIMHQHPELINLFSAYQTGMIDVTKFSEPVRQGIELSKNQEGEENGNS